MNFSKDENITFKINSETDYDFVKSYFIYNYHILNSVNIKQEFEKLEQYLKKQKSILNDITYLYYLPNLAIIISYSKTNKNFHKDNKFINVENLILKEKIKRVKEYK